jgi:hypothetical protein
MHIAAPVIASAPPPAAISPPAAAATSAHPAYASRQSGQHGNGQPDLDLVNQSFCLIHI